MATNLVNQNRPVVGPLVSYVFGVPLPLPEVLEKNSESVWALFDNLQNDGCQDETVPMQLL